MSVATFTRSRRDQWPSFPGDGRWFQGEAGWGLVTWSPGGGREASFVCLAEYAILSPGHTPHRMSGQLTPLWLPQVSWSRVSLLCCLNIMVRIQQTMPAPHVTALVSHYPRCSALSCSDQTGAKCSLNEWILPCCTLPLSGREPHVTMSDVSSFRPRQHNYRKFSYQWFLHYPDHT